MIDVSVYDQKIYKDSISESGEELLIGSDLFLHLCYDCHSPNKLFDTTGFYNVAHNLNTFLLVDNANHGNWSSTVIQRLDSFDVAAIQYYIDRYKRNEKSSRE